MNCGSYAITSAGGHRRGGRLGWKIAHLLRRISWWLYTPPKPDWVRVWVSDGHMCASVYVKHGGEPLGYIWCAAQLPGAEHEFKPGEAAWGQVETERPESVYVPTTRRQQ